MSEITLPLIIALSLALALALTARPHCSPSLLALILTNSRPRHAPYFYKDKLPLDTVTRHAHNLA